MKRTGRRAPTEAKFARHRAVTLEFVCSRKREKPRHYRTEKLDSLTVSGAADIARKFDEFVNDLGTSPRGSAMIEALRPELP